MSNSFNFLEVKFQELTQNVNTWIQNLYNKSNLTLSPADPYGQILQAVSVIYESSILYLKNVTSKFDINNPNNSDPYMVRALAVVGGYNPTTAISATGTISLQLQSGADISDIGNNSLVILNKTQLTNNTNGLNYFLDLGVDSATYVVSTSKKIYLPIVQGSNQSQTFTGTGLQSQSYSIVLPNSQTCEQYRILVYVNGQVWTRVENLNDMLPQQNAYYTKAGNGSGLNVVFGTTNFGAIPAVGAQIIINYVVSDGSLGNIPALLIDNFTFVDDIYDGLGATVDITSMFHIYIENEISFGADAESVDFTKAILPYVSRNFVLARPEQYIFTLKRLGIFSQIDAFTTQTGNTFINQLSNDDCVVYLFLVPNISLYVTENSSYFDLDETAFVLDDTQQAKIETWLRSQGTMAVGTAVKILDPIVLLYVINIHLRIYVGSNEDNIRAAILTNLSNFFTNIERRGYIDKSSVIAIITQIDGVDSVMVDFISQANEAYFGAYNAYVASVMAMNPNQDPSTIVMQGFQPNTSLGLDPILGDIIYNKNEIPRIYGGFADRNGVYYQATPQTTGLSSVNIYFDEIVSPKLFS
jgi:hypothetical protein